MLKLDLHYRQHKLKILEFEISEIKLSSRFDPELNSLKQPDFGHVDSFWNVPPGGLQGLMK